MKAYRIVDSNNSHLLRDIPRPTISLDSDLRDTDAAGRARSAPAGDWDRKPKTARFWSRLRERFSLSSRAGREHSFSMRPPKTTSRRARSRATRGEGSGSDGTAVEPHGGLVRARIDRRFPPLGVKEMPSYGCPPFRGGGVTLRGDMLLTTTTPLSQRAEHSPLWSRLYPKRRIRRGTTRISRVRCKEAMRGCASRAPSRPARPGAAREGCWWRERPPLFGRWCGAGVAPSTVIPAGRLKCRSPVTLSGWIKGEGFRR